MTKQMGRMIYMTEAPVSSEKLCKNKYPQTKRKSRVYAKKKHPVSHVCAQTLRADG